MSPNVTRRTFMLAAAAAACSLPGAVEAQAAGLFVELGRPRIPAGTGRIRTSGFQQAGIGAAYYAHDPAVNAAYVRAHPRTAFLAADGRGFRLDMDHVDPRFVGAIGDGRSDDSDAWTVACAEAAARRLPVVVTGGGTFRLVCKPDAIGSYGNQPGVAVYRAVDIDLSNLTIRGEGATLKVIGHGPGRQAVNYAFATAKNMRAGTLSNIAIEGLTFDFDPRGDPSQNKRSLYLVGVTGVTLRDILLTSSGPRAGGTITLQNCRTVRVANLRLERCTQGMNLSYVDDIILDGVHFDNFSEGIDCDRVVRGLRASNLTFLNAVNGAGTGGGARNGQCLDLNSVQDAVISGINVDNVGGIFTLNYKHTTPPTYADYVRYPNYPAGYPSAPVYVPSRDVRIEGIRGRRTGSTRMPSFNIYSWFASPLCENVTVRDVQLTECEGVVVASLVKNLLLEDIQLDGVVTPAANFGAITLFESEQLQSRVVRAASSATLRNIRLTNVSGPGAGVRNAGFAAVTLDGVTVERDAARPAIFFQHVNLEVNPSQVTVRNTVARNTARATNPNSRAHVFTANRDAPFQIRWEAGNRNLNFGSVQPMTFNGTRQRALGL